MVFKLLSTKMPCVLACSGRIGCAETRRKRQSQHKPPQPLQQMTVWMWCARGRLLWKADVVQSVSSEVNVLGCGQLWQQRRSKSSKSLENGRTMTTNNDERWQRTNVVWNCPRSLSESVRSVQNQKLEKLKNWKLKNWNLEWNFGRATSAKTLFLQVRQLESNGCTVSKYGILKVNIVENWGENKNKTAYSWTVMMPACLRTA